VATVAATAGTVFGRQPTTALSARTGLCIVGNFRTVDGRDRQRWVDDVAPALAARLAGTSTAVVGDDPNALVTGSIPMGIAVGPLADPTPWLRASRVVLVPFLNGAEHWLAAAAACGTPALVLPEDRQQASALVDAVAALVTNDDLWHRFAPGGPAQGAGVQGAPAEASSRDAPVVAPDPLASLRALRGVRIRALGVGGIRWVGQIFAHNSLAHVNRELVWRLSRNATLPALRAATDEQGSPPADSVRTLRDVVVEAAGDRYAPAALEIRHQWPPDFTPVTAGRLVLIQHWEFGGLPAEWIGPLRDVVDELWVATTWVRDMAVESGVPAGKVAVVPVGVDATRFRPDGPRLPLRTTKGTRLLFVGGCIPRKGIDVLLETYLATFTEDDDVCLVVKPFGSEGVYANSSVEADVRRAAAGRGASIEMVDGDLSDDDMAALFRSCDALVHPYRGEGFGMPIAEAMASGLAVIVTGGGAADDFCDADTGWILPSRRVDIHPGEWTPTAAGTWWLEPDRQALAAAMLAVVADPDKGRHLGRVGRARMVERFSWDVIADAVAARISALIGEARVARFDEELLVSRGVALPH
jgi:glycosyltransferase involved in cell wall biosynthesis